MCDGIGDAGSQVSFPIGQVFLLSLWLNYCLVGILSDGLQQQQVWFNQHGGSWQCYVN